MKIILLISTLFLFCCCKPHGYTYEILGSMPSHAYNGELIYLVPFQNASPETVDSTRIIDGQFIFSGVEEEVKIIRMRPSLRLAIQELVVVTEPGTIYVNADSSSSVYGTPQNEILQNWKNCLMKTRKVSVELYQKIKESNSAKDSLSYELYKDSLVAIQRDFNYQILRENQNNTVGEFIYKMTYHSLNDEQKNSLSESLHRTFQQAE